MIVNGKFYCIGMFYLLYSQLQVSQARKDEIKRMTFTQLKAALQSGDVSAVEALHTYQAAALDAHKRTNCLVEPIWEAEVTKGSFTPSVCFAIAIGIVSCIAQMGTEPILAIQLAVNVVGKHQRKT